jgi:HAD superfamily hydrolase (TIGR01458 family)
MSLQRARALVFDLDGTLYQEGTPIDGAVDTVRTFRDEGYPLRFLTNTTSKSRADVHEKLRGFGFPVEIEEIQSPPAAAGAFLRERDASAHLLVQEAALPDFEGVSRSDDAPDYVVVGDLGAGWTFERLNRAFRLLHGGARLIGLGRTRFWQAEGGLQLDAGPFITALEYATGEEALVLGKPDPAFFEAILEDLGLPAEEVALAGDDVETDVGAAMKAGLIGVQVRTGKFRDGDLERSDAAPDRVVDSVADLI